MFVSWIVKERIVTSLKFSSRWKVRKSMSAHLPHIRIFGNSYFSLLKRSGSTYNA